MDRAATVIVPVTSPDGDTVPSPLTWRNTPLTGTRPHMLLLLSRIAVLDPSRTQNPAAFPSCSTCAADGVIWLEGDMCPPSDLIPASNLPSPVRLDSAPHCEA